MKRKLRVYYAVLNMGLGHATRSLPLIREFRNRGAEVWVGSNGRALNFLRPELPEVHFIQTPDYNIRYSKGRRLIPVLLAQVPRILSAIREEQRLCTRLAVRIQPHLIISDHCYGAYHRRIPSFFISHQINFILPEFLRNFQSFGEAFNRYFHRRYTSVWIPDQAGPDGGLLSGSLSCFPDNHSAYRFAGILSSIQKENVKKDLDVLASISGPEPQRSLFEKKMLAQIQTIPGKKIVVCGKSETNQVLHSEPDLTVYSHLSRQEINALFNRAKLIIGRSGYSTLMELAETGNRALLVPTPGQTEQEYLAKRARQNQWYFAVEQDHMQLAIHIPEAQAFRGPALTGATNRSLSYIFDTLLQHFR